MQQTSYTSWQSKYSFFLSGYREQSCQQRQSWGAWSGVPNVSCTKRFYSKPGGPGSPRGWHSLGHEPPATVPAPSSSMEQGSAGFPGFWGSITWVAHLCSYFHIVSQFFWLLEARYFSTWTVAVCTPKAFISGQQGDIQYFFLWQQGHIQYFFLWWQTWFCTHFVIQAQRSSGAINRHK